MENRIKIIIIDDDEFVCAGIEASLSKLPDVEILGVFHQTENALAWLNEHTADIATVDCYMPGVHGLEFLNLLKADYPDMKLITITSEKNPYVLRQVLNTDVDSLLLKGSFKDLQDTVCAVIKGETRLQPELGIPIFRAERATQAVHTLTETQRICFEQIALGKSIEEIAHLQNTTANTVKDRLLQCRKKFQVKTTEDLIKLYHEFYPTEMGSSSTDIKQIVDIQPIKRKTP